MDKEHEQTQSEASLQNVASFPTLDSARLPEIKERAASWLVRLNSGEISPEEEQALAEWMEADELHREALFKLAKQWDSMAILSDLAALFPLPNTRFQGSARHAPSAENSDKRGWGGFGQALSHYAFSRFFQGAVAFSLVCTLAIVFLPAMQKILLGVGAPHYVTVIGERSTFTLSDGSVVTLNTNSELVVDFSEGRRDIRLSRGEANFDVAKNPDRPFVVRAGDGVVWAVGTPLVCVIPRLRASSIVRPWMWLSPKGRLKCLLTLAKHPMPSSLSMQTNCSKRNRRRRMRPAGRRRVTPSNPCWVASENLC